MMPSKFALLDDFTSPANTAVTRDVDTQEFDSIGYAVVLIGGVAPAGQIATLRIGPADLVTFATVKTGTITTGADSFYGAMGLGLEASASFNGGPMWGGPLAYGARLTVPALGVGISVRVRIWGRRNRRGPDIAANPD